MDFIIVVFGSIRFCSHLAIEDIIFILIVIITIKIYFRLPTGAWPYSFSPFYSSVSSQISE